MNEKAWTEQALSEVVELIEEGELNALKVVANIKVLSDALSAIRAAVMNTALSELSKFGNSGVPLYGVILSSIETGVGWDFEVCEDLEYQQMQIELETQKLKIKERENILKRFTSNPFEKEFVVEDTGEVVMPKSAPIRSSTQTVKVEYVKQPKPKNPKK